MLQEDSNGETFEIIEKKNAEEAVPDKILTESVSSVSSSVSLLPSPSTSIFNTANGAGNVFSNVAPPSSLPSFIPAVSTNPSPAFGSVSSDFKQQIQSTPTFVPTTMQPDSTQIQMLPEPYYPTQFSAAIPPSKGVQHGVTPLSSSPSATNESGFMGWMKGAVGASGDIFTKVAERARNSVETMITTLDPQMREFIHSGGDLNILIASGQEVKISPIQEAFQTVFGKATVRGLSVQATNIAAQPVGFAAGIKAAEERIQTVFKNPNVQPMPVIALENFLLEVGEDKWYDLGVLLLNDPVRQITLQTFTQMTPVPTTVVTLAHDDTPDDYPLKWSGYSVTIGNLMARNLGVNHTEWHYALTGVSRREMILLAAKSLATLYKATLSQIA